MLKVSRRALLSASLVGFAGAVARSGDARAADRVRLGKAIASSFPFAGLELGVQQGLWRAQGLEPSISAFRGDGQMQQALAAGSIDFGVGSGPGMGYAAKGVPARAVAVIANQPQNMGLVVGTNSGVRSLDDLRGRRIGVSTAGSLTDWLTRNIASSRGWAPGSIESVPMGEIRTRLLAMQAGELAGAVTSIQQAYEIQEAGQGRVLATFGEVVPHFHTHVIFARDELIERNPDLVRRVLKGWFRIAAFMRDHRAETVRSIAGTMKISERVIDETYGDEMAMISFDGRFDPQALEVIRQSLRDLEILDFIPATAAMYTDRFVPVSVE